MHRQNSQLQRRPLPASEQPRRRGQGRSEFLEAAAAQIPRPAAAPASLCPAAPRHLPNLCPTMARPDQPRNHFRGEIRTIERRGAASSAPARPRPAELCSSVGSFPAAPPQPQSAWQFLEYSIPVPTCEKHLSLCSLPSRLTNLSLRFSRQYLLLQTFPDLNSDRSCCFLSSYCLHPSPP